MAIVVKKVVLKSFNWQLLAEQLVLPPYQMDRAGFIPSETTPFVGEPFPEATRIHTRRTGEPDDFAERGELRFYLEAELTPAEDAALDAVLAAHDHTGRTAEQNRLARDDQDIDQLITGYQAWDTATTAQRMAIIKFMLRVFIRRLRGTAI